jgi:hypothetical protein
MLALFNLLAQIQNLPQDGRPSLPSDTMGTSGMTWIIAGVLAGGILLITFKTSKRNSTLDRD